MRRGLGAIVLLAALFAPLRAEAQVPPTGPEADPKGMAVRLGEEALTLHGQGHFREAYERFETADKIAHSPVFVLWMARSQRALGALTTAKRLYQKVVDEELPAEASTKWISARDDGRSELAALLTKIPRLRVAVANSPKAIVDVDGRVVSRDTEVDVDPGEHRVTAAVSGAPIATQQLRVEEGSGVTVVHLAATKESTSSSKGSLVPGGVALGVGLVGVVAGAITGGYALSLAGQVKDHCIGNQCRRADQGKADDADTLARASTGCIIAGGVIGGVGIGLMIARPRFGSPAPSVSLELGPLRGSLSIAF